MRAAPSLVCNSLVPVVRFASAGSARCARQSVLRTPGGAVRRPYAVTSLLRSLSAISSASPGWYFRRGQKNPRSPSPRWRGTTCTCRCGTLWLTRLFMATNEPSAPSPRSTAAAMRCGMCRMSGPTSSGGRSRKVSTWTRGTTRTCPGNTGRWSRKPRATSSSSTTSAGSVPATMAQNGHGVPSVVGVWARLAGIGAS